MTKWGFATIASILLLSAGNGVAVAQTGVAVGIYPSYPPLDMRDPATGKLKGFDVDFGNAVAQKLGIKIEWRETAYVQLIASIQTGRIRLFFNGMNETPARLRLIAFVDYLRSGTQFMTLSGDAATFPSIAALCGKKVAASRGTNLPEQIADWSKANCEAAGKPAVIYLSADNNIDARNQLKQGRSDAMAQDSLTIPFVRSQEPGTYATIGEAFNPVRMGIGVGKDDTALQDRLSHAVQSLIDDGSYAKLIAKWGLPASSAVAKATIHSAGS